MDWTFAKIRTKTRLLAGKQSSTNFTDTTLDEYINNYYQNILPLQLDSFNPGYRTLTLSSATGTYTPDLDLFYTYTKPIYIEKSGENDRRLVVWYDAEEFYDIFTREVPSDTDEHAIPTDVLVQHDRLIFRPVPDAVYTVQLNTTSYMPTALSADGDQPLKNTYGPLIAYGAAIDIAGDYGDDEVVKKVKGFMDSYLGLNFKRNVNKQIGRRSVPSF